jgi:hypothetical protein
MKLIIGAVVTVWLIVGLVATAQRGYYGNDRTVNCGTGATIAVTVLAGPVNYLGAEPRLSCKAPHPSR